MFKYRLPIFVLVILGIFLPAISPALALDPLVPCGRVGQSPCTTCDALALGKNVSDFILFYLVPTLSTLFFIWAGFKILLGGGIPAQVAAGYNIFWTTVYGLLIIFLAWLIVNTVLRTIADDQNIAQNWWKLECRETTSSAPPPIPSLAFSPTRTATPTIDSSTLACQFSGVNLCQEKGSCPANACSQYSVAIQKAAGATSASGLNMAALIGAIMYNESSCNVSAKSTSDPPSCGLMQLQPATANRFKSQCGISANITCDWLRSSSNAEASICIAAKYLKSIAAGTCGSEVRNVAAGYNGGVGACSASRDCAAEKSCDGGAVRRWECLYDNKEQTVCNTGFNETRVYAPKVSACYTKNK